MITLTHVLFLLVALAPQQAPTPTIDRAELEARIGELEGATDVAPGVRDRALADYRISLSVLAAAEESSARRAQFERDLGETTALVNTIKLELATPPIGAPTTQRSLAELEHELIQAETDERTARESLARVEEEARFRADRIPQIPAELAVLTEKFELNERSLLTDSETAPTSEPDLAQYTSLLARREAQRAEVTKLETERAFYEARAEVLPIRIERLARRLNSSKRRVIELRELVNNARQAEAMEAARLAKQKRQQIAHRYPQLIELAGENELLANLRSGPGGLQSSEAQAKLAFDQSQALLEQLTSEFASTKRKVQVAGLSNRMGAVLRRQFEKLPRPTALRGEANSIRRQLGEAQYQLIVHQEERATMRDLDAVASELMKQIAAKSLDERGPQLGGDEEGAELRSVAEELLTSKRSLLDNLIGEYSELSEVTSTHVAVLESLTVLCREYRDYVKERILWVSSVPNGELPSIQAMGDSLEWLFEGQPWNRAWESSVAEARRQAGTLLGLVSLILVLLLLRTRSIRGSANTAERVRSFRTDAFVETWKEILHVLVIASLIPLVCYTTAWFLTKPEEQIDVALAVGNGLESGLTPLIILSIVCAAARRRGLFEAHFRWPKANVDALRMSSRALTAAFVPAIMIAGAFESLPERLKPEVSWSDSTGRVAFVIALIAITLFAWKLTRRSGAFSEALGNDSLSALRRRGRIAGGLLAIVIPVALALLALVGYYYTATELARRFGDTLTLALAVALFHALLLRWLFVARRRLAVEQARQRTEAREGTEPSSGLDIVEEDGLDIPVVDAQTRKLFRSGVAVLLTFGVYFVWADQLPALRILERIQLWPEVALVSVQEEDSAFSKYASAATAKPIAGTTDEVERESSQVTLPTTIIATEPTSEELDEPTRITLANLVLALLTGLLTFVAAKNFPGLLEIALLQRLPLDSGLRFAISTIFRYLILVIGISTALGALGIGWAKVQWLAAAFTFGLAFGLQEIFANFISGLIILIERPIRVGDIVTVNGTEGRVTQLRMRSTTIIDWDCRELLVPNKEFITTSLINWTLSDPVTRIVVPVGIAYGSDTDLARKLLLKAAKNTTGVLDEPAPNAVFLRFGESSLDFQLRIYLADRDQWAKVTDRVHTEIDQLFRKAKIEIAFPQRDLHVRSADGLGPLTREVE